ncbi:hypothetical protein VPH35_085086 [Triticum aestivum]
MLSTGVRRPRYALCGTGANVHFHADAVFLCTPTGRKRGFRPVHCTSSLASRHRLTRVPPPNHVRAEVPARAMGLDPCAARLRAAVGRTHVPPPSDVRARCRAALQLLARRFTTASHMRLRVAMAAALWMEVTAHGGVHDPRYVLQRLAARAHVPDSFLVVMVAVIRRACQVRTTAVDAEEDSIDWAMVKSRTPRELCLFV